MIPRHDPYGPIFEELCDINDVSDYERIRETLHLTRPYVRSLRKAYESTPSCVDYSCPHNRAAYLLAYYPHYIEAVHRILDDVPQGLVGHLFAQADTRACFFGSGPAPEVLGWISFLSVHIPDAQRAVAYLFDKYVNEWSIGREITRYHLASQYWPEGHLVTRPIPCDLLMMRAYWNDIQEKAVSTSSLFVMQNCLNDQLDSVNALLDSLLWLFQKTPIGSLFVFADVALARVYRAMCQIEDAILDSGYGIVLRSTRRGMTRFRSKINMHPVIAEELFTDEDGLYERRNTKYHSLVLQRVFAEDEIPF